MKKEYSKTWNSSKQPRKQRKFRANAPKHVRGKFMSAHLSEELRDKYETRSVRLREGDTVKVTRGDHRGEEGEVQRVDVDRQKVFLAGIEVARRDGSKAHPPIRPSNLVITELDKTDGKRMQKLGGEVEEPEEPGDEDTEEGKEVPARSTVSNMTKDEIKEYADEEWDVELSTNDLKDEMIDQLFEEIGDKE